MIDTLDQEILLILEEDAKTTIKEISERISLSATPVFERIKKLENEGYITGYHAKIDRNKIGRSFLVICNVTLDTHQKAYLEKFQRDIVKFREVRACYHIGGLFDYLLKIVVEDMVAYQKFVSEKLASLDHIGKVQSSFVMKEIKSESEAWI